MDIKKILKSVKDFFTPKKEQLSLAGLYSLTKYGKMMNDQQLEREVITNIEEQIKRKARSGKYTIIFDITPGIKTYKESIIQHLTDAGLTAQEISVTLSDRSEVVKYLLVTWNK